ncbi:hypothetical protein LCGC14_1112680 [marine sediment metagenome]|uniref:Uncharacterized protein n=1 Tax=marine sediment metagenome TaxID=412755 RepID=A0A0F9MB16_9ZZZZ
MPKAPTGRVEKHIVELLLLNLQIKQMPHIQKIRSIQFFPPNAIPPNAILLYRWKGKDPTLYIDALECVMSADDFAGWIQDHGPTDERSVAWFVTLFQCECCPK